MVWLLFICSLVASCASQFWQKKAALLFAEQPHLTALQKILTKPMLLGIFFLTVSAATWLAVLSQWDVSVAYPLLSLNFIIMLFVAHYFFNEKITTQQIVGVLLIVLGVITLGVSL